MPLVEIVSSEELQDFLNANSEASVVRMVLLVAVIVISCDQIYSDTYGWTWISGDIFGHMVRTVLYTNRYLICSIIVLPHHFTVYIM
jgi:hypothetical protein